MYNVGAVSHIPRTHSFIGAKYHFRLQWHWNYFECTVLVHMSAQHMDVKLKRKEKYTALLWSGAQNDRAVCFERTHSENAHFFYGYFISGSENWSMWRHAVVVGVVVVGAVFFFPLTLFMFAHSIQFDFHVHFIGAISRYTQLQLELIALLSRARVNSLYELSFLLKWTDNCYVSLHHPPPLPHSSPYLSMFCISWMCLIVFLPLHWTHFIDIPRVPLLSLILYRFIMVKSNFQRIIMKIKRSIHIFRCEYGIIIQLFAS